MWTQRVMGIVSVVMLAGVAAADDEGERRDLVRYIDDKVDSIASELSGFESDNDDRDLDDALGYARDVKDLVAKLDRVKGSDARAEAIVSTYPRYLDELNNASRYLRMIKAWQYKPQSLTEQCISDESNLQSTIRNYVSNPDDADDALAKLPELGRALGNAWDDKLKKIRETDRAVQSAVYYAQFSVSADKWSYVSSNLGNARSGMHRYWQDKLQATEAACKRLELGEKHPDIEKAIAELSRHRGSAKDTVTRLKKDYNEWLRDVRQLRKFSDEDRDALREVLCTAGEYEMEEKVKAVADRWASQISSVYGSTLGQADRLQSRAQARELGKYKGPREVLAGVIQNLSNLEKLKNYELQGSNNPALRAKLEWGKKRHQELASSCTYTELEISSSDCDNRVRPGSGCRLDCVKVGSTCEVIEFKPDSETSKREGRDQLDAYWVGIDRWYKRDKAELLKKYPSLTTCENENKSKLIIERRMITYDFCSSTVRNEWGLQLDQATLDLSETAE